MDSLDIEYLERKKLRLLFSFNFFLLVLTKLYIMQEPIDNHPSEILTREEELSMADTKDLVKHILYIEAELAYWYRTNPDEEELLPW